MDGRRDRTTPEPRTHVASSPSTEGIDTLFPRRQDAWMESSEDLTEAMRDTSADRPVPVASMGKAQYTVTVARTVEELAGLRGAWESLQGSAVTTDPDHYLTVLRSDPRFRMPHVLLLEEDGVPAAMVIGRIADIRVSCNFGYKTIFRPRLRALNVVYDGVLGDRAEVSRGLAHPRAQGCARPRRGRRRLPPELPGSLAPGDARANQTVRSVPPACLGREAPLARPDPVVDGRVPALAVGTCAEAHPLLRASHRARTRGRS